MIGGMNDIFIAALVSAVSIILIVGFGVVLHRREERLHVDSWDS
jgi:hypothetical protein